MSTQHRWESVVPDPLGTQRCKVCQMKRRFDQQRGWMYLDASNALPQWFIGGDAESSCRVWRIVCWNTARRAALLPREVIDVLDRCELRIYQSKEHPDQYYISGRMPDPHQRLPASPTPGIRNAALDAVVPPTVTYLPRPFDPSTTSAPPIPSRRPSDAIQKAMSRSPVCAFAS